MHLWMSLRLYTEQDNMVYMLYILYTNILYIYYVQTKHKQNLLVIIQLVNRKKEWLCK